MTYRAPKAIRDSYERSIPNAKPILLSNLYLTGKLEFINIYIYIYIHIYIYLLSCASYRMMIVVCILPRKAKLKLQLWSTVEFKFKKSSRIQHPPVHSSGGMKTLRMESKMESN
jgi:hypothetical protein